MSTQPSTQPSATHPPPGQALTLLVRSLDGDPAALDALIAAAVENPEDALDALTAALTTHVHRAERDGTLPAIPADVAARLDQALQVD